MTSSDNPFDEQNRPLSVPIDDGFDFEGYSQISTSTSDDSHVEHEHKYFRKSSVHNDDKLSSGRSVSSRNSSAGGRMHTPSEMYLKSSVASSISNNRASNTSGAATSPMQSRGKSGSSSGPDVTSPIHSPRKRGSRSELATTSPMHSPVSSSFSNNRTSSGTSDYYLNTGKKQQRHISFVSEVASPTMLQSKQFSSEIQEVDLNDDDNDSVTPSRANTVMKRHRWGTQRHKKGRPKRSKSVFRKSSINIMSKDTHQQQTSSNEHTDLGNEDPTGRKVFFSIPLPTEMVSPETGLPLMYYPRNKIRTTKYTPLSFVPKNLWYQFHNIANIFFLLIAILGAFPIFGVTDAGLAAVPIIVIVTMTGIKDSIEDYRRTLLDIEVNNTKTEILAGYHNYNVADENISLWRQFKKANTRLVVRIARAIKRQRNKNSRDGEKQNSNSSPFSEDLARATTVNSVYSLNDIPSKNSNPFEDHSPDDYNDDDDGNNRSYDREIQPRITSSGSSVCDLTRQVPGKAKFRRDFWKNVHVGDFVRIRNNDEIPADIVILATSDSDGACYIETKNLDGETNLKVRQALKCGQGVKHARDCECSRFWIESEGPIANLYSYHGVAKWQSDDNNNSNDNNDHGAINSEPININNMLLRGCSLRNTEWAIGVVVFTGSETKIMLNAGITPTKRSLISRELNFSVIANFILLFVFCFISATVNGIAYARPRSSIVYFEFGSIGGSPPVDGLITFWAALILYQSLVPISLYISIEIVKTIQAFFIYSDCYMYYEKLDYPCTPKSWNISDDLGQTEYIFSDKTGTLTQNIMEFKKCTINGVAYGKAYTEALAGLQKRQGIDVEQEGKRMRAEITHDKAAMLKQLRSMNDNPQMVDEKVTFVSAQFVADLNGSSGNVQKAANEHFMLALALCHSVITEPSKVHPGRTDFKAQSPDEAALVATARDMGYTFVERTQKGVILNIQGVEKEYQILNTLEFNSTRKRMSAIVKHQGKIILICKGADSVIYARLKPNEQEKLREETALHLEQFANEGLRTLCIAERELSSEEYQDWNRRHEIASESIVNREEKMEEVADSIERSLSLLGGTAIEDRLQDGVPQAISLLADAGIKLWVLTGDKIETAINIGFSCNLLDNSMELLVMRLEGGDCTNTQIDVLISDYLEKYFNLAGSPEEIENARSDHSPPSAKYALVIDGDTLKHALEDNVKERFLLLCKYCKSVLCCRVSPAQKAAVVRLVKNTLGVMTLAIGDGANDVAMIQEADVGVGIAGEEGRQAVMSSDYAIGQFRFLTRLLLVHGRWSYKRLAEMIPNFFYKNVVFTMSLFWYGIYNNFDGSYLFEYTYVTLFNLAFTSLPVIFMGVLDQDVSDVISLSVPQLYRRGILRLEWNQKKFWVYMGDGVYQSLVAFFFPYFCYAFGTFESPSGRPLDHRYWMGLAVCTIAVVCCDIYVLTNQYRWDWLSVVIVAISILLLFFWTGIYSAFTASRELYKLAPEMYGSLMFWTVCLVGIIACMLPHFCFLAMQKLFYPKDVDIIREQWKSGNFDAVLLSTSNNEDEYQASTSGGSLPDSEATLTNSLPNNNQTPSPPLNGVKRLSKRLSTGVQSWAIPNSNKTGEPSPYIGSSDFTAENSEDDNPGYIKFGRRRVMSEEFDLQGNGGENDSSGKDHIIQDYKRRSQGLSRSTRESLELARQSLRAEQAMPRQSMDSMRVSMELSDLTTAEGLLKVMSNNDQKTNNVH